MVLVFLAQVLLLTLNVLYESVEKNISSRWDFRPVVDFERLRKAHLIWNFDRFDWMISYIATLVTWLGDIILIHV